MIQVAGTFLTHEFRHSRREKKWQPRGLPWICLVRNHSGAIAQHHYFQSVQLVGEGNLAGKAALLGEVGQAVEHKLFICFGLKQFVEPLNHTYVAGAAACHATTNSGHVKGIGYQYFHEVAGRVGLHLQGAFFSVAIGYGYVHWEGYVSSG